MTSFYGEYREKDIVSDEEENRTSRANVDKWIFRLLLILIGFMPLIVLAHTEEVVSPLISDNSLLTSGTKGDLFTYYKALIVLVITIIAGVLLLAKVFFMNGKIRKTILNYFLGVFTIAIVLSTILSPNITLALNGQYNRSDGAISWLCYIALMFIAMNINYPQKAVNYVMYTLMPFVFINLFIITMNFTGNDLMQKQWMQKLVTVFLPEGANLAGGSQLVGTLNQWNYMSGMFAILTVMFLASAIINKNWVTSAINTIVALMTIAIMFMSISTSGFLTVLVMLLVLGAIIFKVENKLKSIILLFVFVILSALMLNTLSKQNPVIWEQSVEFFLGINPYEEENVSLNSFYNGTNIAYASENNFELPVLPERKQSAGSGRLYIWEETLVSLKDRPFFGYGLDSLMYNFPHYNINARAGMWNENTIIDKPHSTYIGILYGTGLFGFISLIAIILVVLKSNLVNLVNRINFQVTIMGVAVISYFIQAMFNDSLPGTSAMIWIFIGMMFAIILNNDEIEELK